MLQMQTANKKANFKSGLVGILAVASAFFTTACPPQPNKFSVSPLENPFSVDEGLPLKAGFKVKGSSIDDVVSTAHSPDYHQFEFSTVQPDKIFVTGQPIHPNNNGWSGLRLELTSLDGKKAEYTLPINVIDTIDVTFFGFPNELYGKKGIPIHSISGDLLDDYSQFGNGLGIEITSPHYTAQNIVYKGDNTFSFSLIPKEAFEGETFVLIKGFDDEGNVEYLQIPMYITGFTNFAPVISAQNFSTKEGGQGSFGVNIIDDEDPLPDLIIGYNSNDFNLSHELVNENLVTIYYSAKDYYQFGPATIEITAEDTKGAISEKIINVTIQPMTDLSYSIKDMTFTFYPGTTRIKTYSISSPTSDMNVEVFLVPVTSCDFLNKEVNVDRNSAQKILDTSITGSLFEFKVEPSEVLENIVELHFSKSGYTQRNILANISKDNATRELIFPQSTREINVWLAALHQLCNEPIVSGGSFKIPLSLAKWGFDIEDKEIPNAVVVIPEGENVPQIWIDKTINVFKDTFGTNIPISYAQEDLPPYENKIYSKYFGGAGSGEVGSVEIVAYNRQNVFYVGDVKFDYNYIYPDYVLNQEILTVRTGASEPSNIDSCLVELSYPSKPNMSPLDYAGLTLYERRNDFNIAQTAKLIGEETDPNNRIELYENIIFLDDSISGIMYVFPVRR